MVLVVALTAGGGLLAQDQPTTPPPPPPTQPPPSAPVVQQQTTETTETEHWWIGNGDLFRDVEADLDLFGSVSANRHTLSHLNWDRFKHQARVGAGAGLTVFMLRYIGIGGEAYTENTAHNWVDNADGYLMLRLPIPEVGLAPYILGGAGHKWDPVDEFYCDGGVGLEFRFNPHVGLFADARAVFPSHTPNYALGRAGLRISF